MLLKWDKKCFVVSGLHYRLGQWDQFERVDFLHRLCRLFYHDINGKITGFDGMIQLWRFRFPDEASFREDLSLLEQSVHHLKKLNLLMDAGTDLRKVSEFNLVDAVSLLDGLTQRTLGIVEPIQVSGMSMVRGAAGYTLYLIWSFITQVASLSTSRSNWRLVVDSGQRLNRDIEFSIQSDGLPMIEEVLEGVPQRSRFNRWMLMRLAAGDVFESREGEWSFGFNMTIEDSNVDPHVIGSDAWMNEMFRASLLENRPMISDEKKSEAMIQKVFELLF
ncbi:MAG: hypothetical protein V4507_13800 [Verrucomicrobiota bacterium]